MLMVQVLEHNYQLDDDGSVDQRNRLFATFHKEIDLIIKFEAEPKTNSFTPSNIK